MKPYEGASPNELLQQSPPFLFVDDIVEIGKQEIMCTKYVSHHEPYFAGHFPGNPIVPGVLLIEMCAQAGMLLVTLMDVKAGADSPTGYLAQVGNMTFYRPAHPGNRLSIYATKEIYTGNYYRVRARVSNARTEEKVCRGNFIVYMAQETPA